MGKLVENDRKLVWGDFMRNLKPQQRASTMTKIDMRAAVDAMDDWFDGNMNQLNGVFPTASRNALTDVEKIGVIASVAMRRFAQEVT